MSLVDIGVNLMGRQFKNRKAVVHRAQEVGVGQIIITSTSAKVSTKAFDLASTMPGVPWLTPRDLDPRPRWNEPKYLPHIVGHVAGCTGKTVDQIAKETTEVARSFFGLS